MRRLGPAGLEPPLWRAPLSGRTFAATSVGPGRLYVRVFEKPARRTFVLDLPSGRELWSCPGLAVSILPVDDGALEVKVLEEGLVTRRSVDTGEARWETRVGPDLLMLLGVVGDRVWLALRYGRLIALDLTTGARVVDRRVGEMTVPQGPITPQGVLYLCTGVGLTVVDLVADATVLSTTRFPGRLAFASQQSTRVSADGRVVFCDERSQVLVVEPSRPSEPRQVAQLQGILTGMEIGDEHLYVLGSEGTLWALGEPASSRAARGTTSSAPLAGDVQGAREGGRRA